MWIRIVANSHVAAVVKGEHQSSFDGFPYYRYDLVCSNFNYNFEVGIPDTFD